MDQTSLFATSEQDAYAQLEPQLLAVVDANWADPAQLRLDPRKNYCSILFGNSVVARLSAGASPTLAILKGKTPIPDTVEDGNFYKLSLSDLADAAAYIPQMQEALQAIIDRIPKDFSCCSRYEECSGKKACTNPNKDMALRCGYRKALHSGKVFYGENRNI
ncbi:MAG: hypothetical protein IJ179_00860 [Oscillospiraceae bacterium]|nr:hypothetical protein [Oscillospiraceae bacterium]